MKKSKIYSLLIEKSTSSRFFEFISSKLSKSNPVIEDLKTEDKLITIYKKKILPNYLFVDPNKVTKKFIELLKEKSENPIILIFVKLDNANEDFLEAYKKELPDLRFRVINKSINIEAFEQLITEIEIMEATSSITSLPKPDEKQNNSDEKVENGSQPKKQTKELEKKIEENIRYKFIKLLGSGQEGIVNLFLDTSENKLIAMKTVKLDGLNELAKKTMREKEEITQKLFCPTLINFLGSNEDESNRYIKMEFAAGGPLSEYMRTLRMSGEELKSDEILNWFTQILIALKVLHNNNISHRDIKPDNILLCENPKALDSKNKKEMIAKLSDLGISKIIEGTAKHTVIGTLHYVAPEVISDLEYNKNVDIWSLAVLLYELSLRTKPFNQLEEMFLRKDIKTLNPQENLQKKIDYRIRYLLMNLLKKNPKNRLDVNEILSLNFIKEKVKELLKIFPEWSNMYPIFKELDQIKEVQCPLEPTLFKEDDKMFIEFCFQIMENVESVKYKKSILGGSYEHTYKGIEIVGFLEKAFLGGNTEEKEKVNSLLAGLIGKRLLINVSNEQEENFNEEANYILSFYNSLLNYDNPGFGDILPLFRQGSLQILSQHILISLIEIFEEVLQSGSNNDKIFEVTDPRYAEFLYGVSIFNYFDLLKEESFLSVNDKHAFLLNLYQIMIIHNLIKEKFALKKKKNLISALLTNDVAINYKFKDCTLNNLEIRHGLFRGNRKPLENYYKILSKNDPRLEIIKNLKISLVDLLVVNELFSLELVETEERVYIFRVFEEKNIEFQLNQYLVDFSNKCLSIDTENEEIIKILPLYKKYFEEDLEGVKGILTGISAALSYNDNIEYSILQLRNVDNNLCKELKNVNKICNKIKSGALKLAFES